MSIGKVIMSICSIIFIWLVYLFTLPVLNIGFLSGFIFFAFILIILIGNIGMWYGAEDEILVDFGMPAGVTFGIVIVIGIICAIIGAPWFNANTMQEQLPEAEVRDFTDDIAYMDLTQVPIVDEEYAIKLADKKLGENPSLGSQVNVGEFVMQNVNGELILVAPLVHSGFFEWSNNSGGTPGYITVSASNPQDVRLVQEINGEDIKIKYQPEAYWGEDLKRHIYANGYGTTGTTDYSFELDDSGNPYWVITTYENKTLYGTAEATGVAVVNAQTGETKGYSISETPEWVDRIQPMNFVYNQIANQGEYIKGPFNWSNSDKFMPTNGMAVIYNEGRCYYYTGLTSIGSDESIMGFYLVDTRTKEVFSYTMKGAHENAAMKSIEGKVQDLGYVATFPIPVNIDGIPSYFLKLKDKEGLIKSYGFVNIDSYDIAATGDTIQQAMRNYTNMLYTTGNNVAFEQSVYQKDITGIVDRINSKVESGETTYILTLIDDVNIYTISSLVSEEVTITEPGDEVNLTYVESGANIVNISDFDNLDILTIKSENQEIKDEMVEEAEVETEDSKQNTIIEVKPTEEMDLEWDNLSDEEKAAILNGLNEE